MSVKDARGASAFLAKAEGAYGQDNWMKKRTEDPEERFRPLFLYPLYILRSCRFICVRESREPRNAVRGLGDREGSFRALAHDLRTLWLIDIDCRGRTLRPLGGVPLLSPLPSDGRSKSCHAETSRSIAASKNVRRNTSPKATNIAAPR